MSKRFTDATKWTSKPWFRRLSPVAKLLWLYMCDTCDVAGVINLDMDMASFMIGAEVTDKHLAELEKQVEMLDCGKLWIIGFVGFQYGELSELCRPHQKIIRVLKGYTKGIHTLLARVQEQDKEKDKDKDIEERGVGKTVPAAPVASGKSRRFVAPSVAEVAEYCQIRGNSVDPERFVDYYSACEWVQSAGKKIKDWRAAVRLWERNERARPAVVAERSTARTDIEGEFLSIWAAAFGYDMSRSPGVGEYLAWAEGCDMVVMRKVLKNASSLEKPEKRLWVLQRMYRDVVSDGDNYRPPKPEGPAATPEEVAEIKKKFGFK